MFSGPQFNPQLLAAAMSELSSILSQRSAEGVASLSSRRLHHRTRRNISHRTRKKEVKQLLEAWDVSFLPKNLTAEELCPLLNIKGHVSPLQLQELHTSMDTFFENKTGFPEPATVRSHRDDFLTPSLDTRILHCNAFQGLLRRTANNIMYSQRRGFKTERAEVYTGINSAYLEESERREKQVHESKSIADDELVTKIKRKLEDIHERAQKTAQTDRTVQTDRKGVMVDPPPQTVYITPQNQQNKMRTNFIYYAAFALLLLVIINSTTGRGIFNATKPAFQISHNVDTRFNDVLGVDEAKEDLQDVVSYLRNPEKYTRLGAKLPKGVLLVGPPGVGKTLLARAVAGEADVPFIFTSGSEFDEMFVGTGARRIRDLFAVAKKHQPCIIFIDEIDSVGAKRTSSEIHPYANQTINQLLAEMDGFTKNNSVIVIGATNRKDVLDEAVRRPGRFDVEVTVNKPDLKSRVEILKYYLDKIQVSDDIDIDKVGRGTFGMTGADLENIVNMAALKAATDNAEKVSTKHLDYARDKVLMGAEKKYRLPDEETNWITAFHEAGHTLVAWYTKGSKPIHKVTIIQRGQALGHTSFIPSKEEYNQTREELFAYMDVCMGGRVAEELVYGYDKITTGASSDFQQATSLATNIVKHYGMSEKVGVRFVTGDKMSHELQQEIDAEIRRLLQESYERAKTVLKTHAKEHKLLAEALMKHETLDKSHVETLLAGKPLMLNTDGSLV